MAKANNKRGRKILIFSLLGAVLIGLTLTAILRKREVILTVQTEKVARRSLTELVTATGKIQPVVQVVINPEVSGEIIALPVKEGQHVEKGAVLVNIKQDNYLASRNSAEASYKSALAAKLQAQAELDKSAAEFHRNQELFTTKLVSDSVFLDFKTAYEVSKLRFETSEHQVDQAKAALDRAVDDLAKTTILSPIAGTVTKLKSQLGERVLGTSMMTGTEIMTIANLDDMEARVDIGEIDVVLIAIGEHARLEVDAFRDRKFNGQVYEIANAAKTASAGTQQEATKFEVKIRITDREQFRPGMSVTAEVETRQRTNVLCVPIQSVTTRLPKEAGGKAVVAKKLGEKSDEPDAAAVKPARKAEAVKPQEVAFIHNQGAVQAVKVKRGISDDQYVEITEGLTEGQEVVSGGYKAINRELEDGKKVKVDNAKRPPAAAKPDDKK